MESELDSTFACSFIPYSVSPVFNLEEYRTKLSFSNVAVNNTWNGKVNICLSKVILNNICRKTELNETILSIL